MVSANVVTDVDTNADTTADTGTNTDTNINANADAQDKTATPWLLNKKQGEFLRGAIDRWAREATVDAETARNLRQSFSIRSFDFKKLAKYSFWAALSCLVIAIGAALADNYLLELLEVLFGASDGRRSLMLGLLAAGAFCFGAVRRRAKPDRVFSTEAIFFIGALLCAASIVFLCSAVDGDSSMFFLLTTLVYGALGLTLGSRLIWVLSLLSLGLWFGAATGYASGRGAYYLGMNYPLRFVLFGLTLTGASFCLRDVRRLTAFAHSTYVMGLLYLFIALWILSIFGNHDAFWSSVRRIEFLHWSLLFALAAVAAIVYGLKRDDYTSRSFGIVFLFINLYTRYFEFFWEGTHKAVFFLLLALSFWLVGSHAEKIWNLEFLKPDASHADIPPEAQERQEG